MKEKRKQVNIRMSEEQFEQLKRVAKSYEMNVSEFVIYATIQLEKTDSLQTGWALRREHCSAAIITDRIGDLERKLTRKIEVLTDVINSKQ